MRYQNYSNGWNILLLLLIISTFFGGARIFFGLFGILLAVFINFLPLILLGSFAYLIIKRISTNKNVNKELKSHTVEHQRFVELLIHILVHLIKADHKVDDRELQALIGYFHQKMKFSYYQIVWVQDCVNHSLNDNYSLTDLCEEFSSKFEYESKLMLLELLYFVAHADNVLDHLEQKMIDDIVGKLKISAKDHNQIKAMHVMEKEEQNNHDILGVSPTSSKEDIKKAFKNAVKKYHPDKVQHLGEEFRQLAEEKMLLINKAYKALI